MNKATEKFQSLKLNYQEQMYPMDKKSSFGENCQIKIQLMFRSQWRHFPIVIQSKLSTSKATQRNWRVNNENRI